MQARTVGLDLAKNTFEIHDDGLVVARRALRRSEILAFFRKLASLVWLASKLAPPRIIGLGRSAGSGTKCF